MNGDRLLDSNILIYLSKKILNLDEICDEDMRLSISIITYMEAMGYHFSTSREKRFMKALIKQFNVINLEEGIVKHVITLREKYKIKLPDAIIAATALENKLVLITRNTKDFMMIKGLKLYNPF